MPYLNKLIDLGVEKFFGGIKTVMMMKLIGIFNYAGSGTGPTLAYTVPYADVIENYSSCRRDDQVRRLSTETCFTRYNQLAGYCTVHCDTETLR